MIAYRHWFPWLLFYVECLPKGKSDWGYTTDPNKAIKLSPYWQRRFAADCRRVGSKAFFI